MTCMCILKTKVLPVNDVLMLDCKQLMHLWSFNPAKSLKLKKLLTCWSHGLWPINITRYNNSHLNKQMQTHNKGQNTTLISYLLFYVFYVVSHQPAELRTVSGGGRRVLQDGDVRALLDLTVDPWRAAGLLTWSTHGAATFKHVPPRQPSQQKERESWPQMTPKISELH